LCFEQIICLASVDSNPTKFNFLCPYLEKLTLRIHQVAFFFTRGFRPWSLVFINILADIPGASLVFINPTPDSCSNIYIYIYIYIYTHARTRTHKHKFLPRYLFIPICYQTNAHTPIHIYIYNIYLYIRFLYKHIVICVPSLIEIVQGVPELCLSGVIYHRILH
jgi:hypothetical protein